MALDSLKTTESHLLIWEMIISFSKRGRMKELHFGMVQDTRAMFPESITIGFEPKRFAI